MIEIEYGLYVAAWQSWVVAGLLDLGKKEWVEHQKLDVANTVPV